jgi:hypothetical protein
MDHVFLKNSVCYRWGKQKKHYMTANLDSYSKSLKPGSHEHFILEHYWGYTAQKNGSTTEYRVRHPVWNTRATRNVDVSKSIQGFYGEAFRPVLSQPIHSSVLAEGSPVTVSFPRNFTPTRYLGNG